jgi:hypothetical protein
MPRRVEVPGHPAKDVDGGEVLALVTPRTSSCRVARIPLKRYGMDPGSHRRQPQQITLASLDPAAGHEFIDHPFICPWVVGAERCQGLSDRRWVDGRSVACSAPANAGG